MLRGNLDRLGAMAHNIEVRGEVVIVVPLVFS